MPHQLPLGIRLRDSSVFASYFRGRNAVVVDAMLALPEGDPPRCVWLQGAEGVGKTHLLQAVCARSGSQGRAAAYLPLLDPGMTPEMLRGCGQLADVCIDDIHVIAKDAAWERAIFSLYQELDEQRGRLWTASSLTPAAVPIQLRDLGSRLSGGLVLTVQPLDDEERVCALQLRAELRGFELPEETARYLMRRLPRDMTSLCAFLDQLDEASLAAQRRLTVPFVKQILTRA